MSHSASRAVNNVRELSLDEVSMVSGGIKDGCIRLRELVMYPTKEPEPFVDQFVKRLPSWVHPL